MSTKVLKGATYVGSYNNPLDKFRRAGDPQSIPNSVLEKRRKEFLERQKQQQAVQQKQQPQSNAAQIAAQKREKFLAQRAPEQLAKLTVKPVVQQNVKETGDPDLRLWKQIEARQKQLAQLGKKPQNEEKKLEKIRQKVAGYKGLTNEQIDAKWKEEQNKRKETLAQKKATANAMTNYPYGLVPSVWKRYDYTSKVPSEMMKEFEGKVGAQLSVGVPSLPSAITGKNSSQFAQGFKNTQRRALAGNKRARHTLLKFNEAVNDMKAEAIKMATTDNRSKKIEASTMLEAKKAMDTYEEIADQQKAAANNDSHYSHRLSWSKIPGPTNVGSGWNIKSKLPKPPKAPRVKKPVDPEKKRIAKARLKEKTAKADDKIALLEQQIQKLQA